ncbi:MAG: co-chaperone GroES [Candidatus Absconditabacteria bacterium]
MTKLVPIEDHIILETIKEEQKTASGIVLPDSKEKPGKGLVLAVGDGKVTDDGKKIPLEVSVGDIVYFTKYSPDEIEVIENGVKKKYLVIRQSSILAKEVK